MVFGALFKMNEAVHDALADLDAALAGALKGAIGEVASAAVDFVPPNPLHALLSQWIGAQMNPINQNPEVLIRDAAGKFGKQPDLPDSGKV